MRMNSPAFAGHKHDRVYIATRATWMNDEPVGDPFGGPAYGEKEMPVIAIAGMAMAASAFAAATTTLAMVAAGMAFAGSALSFVGMVTGNKNLVKIGGIIGIAGGVASLASSFSSMASAAGSAVEAGGAMATEFVGSSAAGAAAGGTDIASALATELPTEVLNGAAVSGGEGVIGSAMGAETNIGALEPPMSGESSAFGSGPSESIGASSSDAFGGQQSSVDKWAGDTEVYGANQDPSSSIANNTAQDPASSSASTTQKPSTASPDKWAGDTEINWQGDAAGKYVAGPDGAPDKGWFDKINDFIKKNDNLLKVGGEFVKGGMESQQKKEQMQMYADMQMALKERDYARVDELYNRYNASIKGMQTPSNLITPTSSVYSTQNGQNVQSGIINRQWAPRTYGA